MGQWIAVLLVELGVLGVAGIAGFTFNNGNQFLSEQVRSVRMDQQQLEVQLNVLTAPRYRKSMEKLDQSLAHLQIALVQAVNGQSGKHAGPPIEFEQNVLPHVLQSEEALPVSTIRLTLTLHIPHAAALLKELGRISQGIATWPSEVRACDVHRIMPPGLQAVCVLDVYHWSDESVAESA